MLATHIRITRALAVLGLCLVLWAAAPRAHAADDLLKGTIDPYRSSVQRGAFLRSAGIDTEMDGKEFAADMARKDGFGKSFDSWSALIAFDKNGNGTIDWFEAQAYRDDQRARILAAFDANKDGRLLGEERNKANKSLAEGVVPKAAITSSKTGKTDGNGMPGETASGAGNSSSAGNIDWEQMRKDADKDGDGKLSDEERAALRDQMRKKWTETYDTNKDGKVDDDERQAAYKAMRERYQQRMVEKYDTNKDGKLDEAEEKAARDARRKEWQQRQDELRKRVVEKYDTNKDGKLDDAEKEAARKQWRENMEKRLLERYDKNKDGKLDEAEKEEARKARVGRTRRSSRGGDGERRRGGDSSNNDKD